jgi:hypothetical protein
MPQLKLCLQPIIHVVSRRAATSKVKFVLQAGDVVLVHLRRPIRERLDERSVVIRLAVCFRMD